MNNLYWTIYLYKETYKAGHESGGQKGGKKRKNNHKIVYQYSKKGLYGTWFVETWHSIKSIAYV